MFSKNTRQLSERVREENTASCTRQAALRAAFESHPEAVQTVAGEDKDLQKYAHHLPLRSFPRCTFKIQKTEENTCQCKLKIKPPSMQNLFTSPNKTHPMSRCRLPSRSPMIKERKRSSPARFPIAMTFSISFRKMGG